MHKQTTETHFVYCHDRINLINILTLKNNTTSYCFTLFICGRSCHLWSFKQCSGLYFILRAPCLFQLWRKWLLLCLCYYYYIINTVNIIILSLNYFSKTTWCPNKGLLIKVFRDLSIHQPLRTNIKVLWYSVMKSISVVVAAALLHTGEVTALL